MKIGLLCVLTVLAGDFANFPVAYCGLKIITSLRSVSLIFSDGMFF
jgi:hypothetical protein